MSDAANTGTEQYNEEILQLENQFAKTSDGSDYYKPVSSRRAAVLVGLFRSSDNNDELHVLLTRRSRKLKSHSGEVCLPGGKNDVGETNIETALRESDEEVGLKCSSVIDVLGEMPPRLSAHLLSVTPVVCLIQRPILNKKRTRSSVQNDTADDDTFVVAPNPHEVESVFTVPLKLFHETSAQHSFYDYKTFYNHTVRIHDFQYEFGGQKFTIWGLTAHILIHVAARVFEGNKTTNAIELDPTGLPRHIDLRVVEEAGDDEEHKIVVSVCADS